jgi:hypothetical protein
MMAPLIFYYCHDHNRPTGGEKHSYQHVDVLNRSGHRAYAYHRAAGHRLTWFDNETAVVDGEAFARLYDPRRDYLVFPEDAGGEALRYPGRRVIFNKNLFRGFRALGVEGHDDPYRHPATVAIFAVSDHNAEQLRLCYPDQAVHRVFSSIRLDLFNCRGPQDKRPLICSIQKNAPHQLAVYHTFRQRCAAGRNAGAGWSWTLLGNRTEREVAEILRQSSAFVFTSVDEGLPRLPLEAMASGCLLVAYRDGPLAEIAPSYLRCHYGDVAGLTGWLERIVADGVERHWEAVEEGRRIAAAFDRQRQTASVCSAWAAVLEGARPDRAI